MLKNRSVDWVVPRPSKNGKWDSIFWGLKKVSQKIYVWISAFMFETSTPSLFSKVNITSSLDYSSAESRCIYMSPATRVQLGRKCALNISQFLQRPIFNSHTPRQHWNVGNVLSFPNPKCCLETVPKSFFKDSTLKSMLPESWKSLNPG